MRRGIRLGLYGLLLLLSTRLRAQEADLGVFVEPRGAIAGQDAFYTVSVYNFGAAAQNVVITDVLPDHSTFVSVQPATGWDCGLETMAGKPAVLCRLSSMPTTDPFGPRPTFTITIRVAPDFPLAQGVANTVTISSDTPESRTIDNSATTLLNVDYFSDLSAGSSVSPATIPIGETATITLDLENRGPSEARYTTFQDTLPPFVSFLGLEAPGWSCVTPAIGSSGEISCDRHLFPPGSSSHVRITVRADRPGKGTNVGKLDFGAADLTREDRTTLAGLEAVAPVQVPALSPAGLAALAAALIAAGFVLLRRRAGEGSH